MIGSIAVAAGRTVSEGTLLADVLKWRGEAVMKDGLLLLLIGLACAAVGWMFWHYAGKYASSLLLIVVLLSVVADNWRLRRELEKLKR
ncbi:hypothetical protein [Pseudoduganella sp. RAF53_2]|uniref:hypothetical protein n=1 Tax=unclassified Pseudoduganella TaxID=2637179 RepID=UPI003F9AEBA6